MIDSATIWWALAYGAIGGGLLLYGWRQRRLVPAVAGVALCVLPMLTANPWALAVTGVVLLAAVWLVRF